MKKCQLSSSGGLFKERLDELETSGFIQSFLPYKVQKKGIYYKIYDEYTFFYLRWIEDYARQGFLKKQTIGKKFPKRQLGTVGQVTPLNQFVLNMSIKFVKHWE